ncbi:MAG: thiamine pyrophosphate-dependent dehydrogenase E1 component subunit alpha [Gammaproteobacteria bacterium]|nr:thiamine pyrophosphate-dependent dehydrogenase E1 component subunit alpha [Gammaproteobacteria bacterium]
MRNNIDIEMDLFYTMLRIRKVEEAIADRYKEQKMRTPVHLSIGQESVAAVVGRQLYHEDYCVSTHRAHAHYLAKGGSLQAMISEIYGKVTGCCRGRGGSMHLIDTAVGFMGSTAIVGNTIPIGVGLGLSLKLAGHGKVSCIFLGDGAVEEGVFYESLNIAVLKKLPVLFVCENNRYSVYSPFSKRQPAERKIYEIAKAMGATIYHGDGYDVLASHDVARCAIASIREGGGPCFLEFETYRWREHCGPNYDNDLGYRTENEFLSWKARDPLEVFRVYLVGKCRVSKQVIKKMEEDVDQEIEVAFELAETAPFPKPIEAVTGEYKSTEANLNCSTYKGELTT